MKCPHCNGNGGTKDWFGEWSECWCCDGSGKPSKARVAECALEIKRTDAEIDRMMAALSSGLPIEGEQ